jgi:hypothetical protein
MTPRMKDTEHTAGLLAATEGALARTGNLASWRRKVLGEPSYAAPGLSESAQPVPGGPFDRVRMNALETPEQPVPLRGITHWPLADDATPYSPPRASFDIIGYDGATVTIATGRVRYHGRAKLILAEGDAEITGGTEENPQWVSVRVQLQPTLGTPELCVTDEEPETDESWFYKPLYTLYLESGAAVFVQDWRLDVDLMSPIA